ncbi:MAG: AAA family ATPase [Lachnospiraceae bacterium]|nr:AAA family ATPase [Lachnospiraceae bacterium]
MKNEKKKKNKNKKIPCWNRIIALANQKGGVGKSTTAINLSACLAEAGKKVLTIDMDPQGNATSGLGVEKNQVENSIYELLIGNCEIEDAIIPLERTNHHLIASNVNLAAAELELFETEDKEYLLKNHLDKIRDQYDFVIIDCPPSLNMLTINALTSADTVLVPLQCEYYALEGLAQLMYTVQLIQERMNEKLVFEGVVFTMFDGRTNLANQVMQNVKDNLNEKIYNTVINRNVRLAEAPSYGMPIIDYDSRSTGAENYRNLAREIMGREEN